MVNPVLLASLALASPAATDGVACRAIGPTVTPVAFTLSWRDAAVAIAPLAGSAWPSAAGAFTQEHPLVDGRGSVFVASDGQRFEILLTNAHFRDRPTQRILISRDRGTGWFPGKPVATGYCDPAARPLALPATIVAPPAEQPGPAVPRISGYRWTDMNYPDCRALGRDGATARFSYRTHGDEAIVAPAAGSAWPAREHRLQVNNAPGIMQGSYGSGMGGGSEPGAGDYFGTITEFAFDQDAGDYGIWFSFYTGPRGGTAVSWVGYCHRRREARSG